MQEAMTTAVANDFYIDSIDCLHVIRALTSFQDEFYQKDKTGEMRFKTFLTEFSYTVFV